MLLTLGKRTKDAIRFKVANGNSCWIALAKTTAWSVTIDGVTYDDTSPPPEDSSTTALEDLICAIKATVYWVKQDDSGTFQFNDINGDIVKYLAFADQPSAIAGGCQTVLIQASSLGTTIAVSEFRQVGVYTDLTPASGHTSDTFLIAANVADWGQLEGYENKTPREVSPESVYVAAALFQY